MGVGGPLVARLQSACGADNVITHPDAVVTYRSDALDHYRETPAEVVLSDGEVVEMHRDDPGYDLLGAFVGSEGTLGVATRIELRVVPVPESVRTLVAFFDDTVHAAEAVTAIVAAGIVPGAIEMMD